MNKILKKSNMYIIGGCLIVIFITIGIVIYILTRKKSGGGGGGGGYKYTEEPLSGKGMMTVCSAPYSSSFQKSKYVKDLCDLDPDCKGYYGDTNDTYTWFVATDKDPSECTEDKGGSTFTKYFKKPDYNSIDNTSGEYGCQLKTSNTCDNKVCADGKYVENLCNLDPDCVGYYTSADKKIIVATNNTDITNFNCSDYDLKYSSPDSTTMLTLFNRRSQV